jgi:hypothetical protein
LILSHSIPEADAESWRIENWRTNFNASMHPPELMSFFVYNITNLDDVLAGQKPIVDGAKITIKQRFLYFHFYPAVLSLYEIARFKEDHAECSLNRFEVSVFDGLHQSWARTSTKSTARNMPSTASRPTIKSCLR